jgi:hypothetical protein
MSGQNVHSSFAHSLINSLITISLNKYLLITDSVVKDWEYVDKLDTNTSFCKQGFYIR